MPESDGSCVKLNPFVNLQRDALVKPESNPPLITDYLNFEVTVSLGYFSKRNSVRLNYSLEQYPTAVK